MIISTAPNDCPDCGEAWSAGMAVDTGDAAAENGWEDWRYCERCGCELFYPQKKVEDE